MKIVCLYKDELFIQPDTVILRDSEQFFAPDFAHSGVKETAGTAVKISRMVKCIEQKFAGRTWNEFTECIDYQIVDCKSDTISKSFDRSFYVTEPWAEKSEMEQSQIEKFDAAIAHITQYFTLRVGDYVFIAND